MSNNVYIPCVVGHGTAVCTEEAFPCPSMFVATTEHSYVTPQAMGMVTAAESSVVFFSSSKAVLLVMVAV